MCTQKWGHKTNFALEQAVNNLCAQEGLQLHRLQQVRLILFSFGFSQSCTKNMIQSKDR